MTAFSDLLNDHRPFDVETRKPASNRALARLAKSKDLPLSPATIDTYTRGSDHGEPDEPTIEAFHKLLGIPVPELRRAAQVQVGEADPWTPPPEADRLTLRQRRALDELIRAMITRPASSEGPKLDITWPRSPRSPDGDDLTSADFLPPDGGAASGESSEDTEDG